MNKLLQKSHDALAADNAVLARTNGQLAGVVKRLQKQIDTLKKANQYSKDDLNFKLKHIEQKNLELVRFNTKIHNQLREANARLRRLEGVSNEC